MTVAAEVARDTPLGALLLLLLLLSSIPGRNDLVVVSVSGICVAVSPVTVAIVAGSRFTDTVGTRYNSGANIHIPVVFSFRVDISYFVCELIFIQWIRCEIAITGSERRVLDALAAMAAPALVPFVPS